MAKRHGKDGMVKIKGFNAGGSAPTLVTLCVTKWSADVQKTEHDVSDTCNDEWQAFEVGKKVVVWSLEGKMDKTVNPLGSTSAVVESDFAAVELYVDKASENPTFDIPTAIVTSAKIDLDQGDVVTFSISGKSSGSVTIG